VPFPIQQLTFVALGGALGSTLRWLVSERFSSSALPWGTAIVNITGCLLIGVVYGLAASKDWLSPGLRLFLATGLLGGFTTFSTFAYEVVTIGDQHLLRSLLLAGVHVILGLAAAWAGLAVARVL